MEGIGASLARGAIILMVIAGLIGATSVGIILGIINIFKSDELRTKEIINPYRVEINVKGIKSDTTYIYKLPFKN